MFKLIKYANKKILALYALIGCEATRLATSKRISINLGKYEKIHVLPTAEKIG